MQIKRESNFYETYDYDFIEGDKTLSIYLGPDCALHFLLKNAKEKNSLAETFTITKENILLYTAFEETYRRIVMNEIYEPSATEIATCQNKEDYESLKQLTEEQKVLIEEFHQKEYDILVKEKNITWYSESDDYENSAHFTIEKIEDSFQLHFQNRKIENKKISSLGGKEFLDVRIGIQASHFFPYNVAFINLYRRLQAIDPEYHQYHIEEMNLSKQKDTI